MKNLIVFVLLLFPVELNAKTCIDRLEEHRKWKIAFTVVSSFLIAPTIMPIFSIKQLNADIKLLKTAVRYKTSSAKNDHSLLHKRYTELEKKYPEMLGSFDEYINILNMVNEEGGNNKFCKNYNTDYFKRIDVLIFDKNEIKSAALYKLYSDRKIKRNLYKYGNFEDYGKINNYELYKKLLDEFEQKKAQNV